MASRALVCIYDIQNSQWVDLPCPSDYSGISTTLVDSGRNSDGVVIGDVVKSDVAKVELKWNYLTRAEYSALAQLLEYNYNGGHFFMPVSFFDIVKGQYEGDISVAPNSTTNKIRLFYPSDRKVAFVHIKLDADSQPLGYENVSLNLIDSGKIYGV